MGSGLKFIFKALLLGMPFAAVTSNAAHLNKGAIVCFNPDVARNLVELSKRNDPNFFEYWEKYESNQICVEITIKMTLLSVKKLNGGISKVWFTNDHGKPQDIFAITREIHQ